MKLDPNSLAAVHTGIAPAFHEMREEAIRRYLRTWCGDIPEPMIEPPPDGRTVFVRDTINPNGVYVTVFTGSSIQVLWLERGLMYDTSAKARDAAFALTMIAKGEYR